MLSGASHVQILPVVSACENFLRKHLTLENCVNSAHIAELYSLNHLEQHILKYICKHWCDFVDSEDFFLLSSQFIIKLLSSGYPVNCCERDVFTSILLWFISQTSPVVDHLTDLLKHINFQYISEDELEEVLNHPAWLDLLES